MAALTILAALAAGAAASEARPVGELVLTQDANLSAAIYSAEGQIVRTLHEAAPTKAGTVALRWDGTDHAGAPAPDGTYAWRAIVSRARGVDDGWIGEMADPPYGVGEHAAHVAAVAVDEQGNVYETSGWEEAHQEVRAWTSDGTEIIHRAAQGGIGIAVDADHVYQVAMRDFKPEQAVVRRYARAGLKLRNWIGAPEGVIAPAGGAVAAAVAGDMLWVCCGDRVQVHDKRSGAMRSSFALTAPRAVAVDARGQAWVAHGDRVSEFAADGTAGRTIAELDKPGALAFGGVDCALHIAETGSGRVLVYDATTLKRRRALFGAARPGPMSDTAFLWPIAGGTSIAVDAQGRITVADIGNHRVLTFTPDGALLRQRYSEMVMAPMVDPAVDPDLVLSHNMEYRVDYRPGKDHGRWRPVANWYGANSTIRRRIEGRHYLFAVTNGKRIEVREIGDDGMRLCAALLAEDGLKTWADGDGDGAITDDECTRSDGAGDYATLSPGVWIDQRGDLWIANWHGATVRVPMLGFDQRHNPLYDWSRRVTAITRDETPWAMDVRNLRIDPASGDIYRLGYSPRHVLSKQSFWMGGSVVERLDADGERIGVFPIHDVDAAVVMATDSDGRFYYTGHSGGDQHWIRMYTDDGLLVTTCRMGGPSGSSGGWMDHGLSLTAFTHPATGVHYAYAEEVYWGKAIRYRIDDLDTLERPPGGTFAWKAAP
ncbi:MAG TPA: FlgD immunoglobulin-like domain containing protein [Planctomycetota bacterium]|nr:FlgD immunoglobulin-like domain containing protein [Planctomycetota bacterium]